ncbi:MAG: 1-(5-phosphoribosyl)-5-((5-phosphoribosylamino)methylideneamino)imidazole-4-carboxamide isomerase, partial [Chrysiogenetes bacterium]|nr:1-(5-phosphoribosyl)-5-((5-phosphoribosylamino)methylideneamino)imidazole-4-carboxamide isomerase [Chrysiogenetes bacterium]
MGRACKDAGIGVILSGGVSSLEDVEQARTLADDGVIGVISGRAIYEGKLDVASAVRCLRGQ